MVVRPLSLYTYPQHSHFARPQKMAEIAGGDDRGRVPKRSVTVHNLHAALRAPSVPAPLNTLPGPGPGPGPERKDGLGETKREDTDQIMLTQHGSRGY